LVTITKGNDDRLLFSANVGPRQYKRPTSSKQKSYSAYILPDADLLLVSVWLTATTYFHTGACLL